MLGGTTCSFLQEDDDVSNTKKKSQKKVALLFESYSDVDLEIKERTYSWIIR